METFSVLWSDDYQTPRSVWAASAIAAALLHGGAVWWGLSTWQQNRRATPSPAPIRVVALPPESETVLAPNPLVTPGDSHLSPAAAVAARTPTESFAPVPPSDRDPATSEPALSPEATATPQPPPPPVEPVAPAPPPNPAPATQPVAPATPAPTLPVPPTASVSPAGEPVAPAPAPQSTEAAPAPNAAGPTPAPVAPPPTDSPADRDRPFPATTGELSPRDSGVQAFWTLQEVPGGSDIPEELPQLPSGWRESTSALLANADCAAGLVPSGSSVRVTLWPIVEPDGSISGFFSWDSGNEGKARVVNCVESLGPRMASLIPARDGGTAIASYAMLLVVELQGIP